MDDEALRGWRASERSSRRVRGLALLAAGTFAHAGCASRTAPVLFEWAPAESVVAVRPCSEGAAGARPATTSVDPIPVACAAEPTVVPAEAPRTWEWVVPSRHRLGVPRKDYAITAGNILGFQVALNQYDRNVISEETYGSDPDTILRNLSGGWGLDEDPFDTNQFLHPYGGAIYHGFARSAGFDYWESLAWDFAASAVWEIAGEADPPSINDQVTTPLAGSFLGEALFRTASLLLERGGSRPSTVREVGAALVAPSAGFNRHVYGRRFKAVYPSRDPAVFGWWGLGVRRN
jgi:hypothetical protein